MASIDSFSLQRYTIFFQYLLMSLDIGFSATDLHLVMVRFPVPSVPPVLFMHFQVITNYNTDIVL